MRAINKKQKVLEDSKIIEDETQLREILRKIAELELKYIPMARLTSPHEVKDLEEKLKGLWEQKRKLR